MVLKILLKQPFHAWRRLPFITQLEHLFLLLIVYAYICTRLYSFLGSLHTTDPILAQRILTAALHVFVLYFLLSAPLILIHLLPRQTALRELHILPVTRRQTIAIVAYYVHKYWLLSWAVFLPLAVTAPLIMPLKGSLTLAAFIIWDAAVFVLFFDLFFGMQSTARPYAMATLLVLILAALVGLFWMHPFRSLVISTALGALVLVLGLLRLNRISVQFEKAFPAHAQQFRPRSPKHSYQLTGSKSRSLFLKDFMNLWRNPHYLKNKMVVLLLLPVSGILCFKITPAHAVGAFSVVLGLLIWHHYSTFFSNRFVQAEPEWFFRLLPIPFFGLIISRFLLEFIFVAIMLGIYSGMLWLFNIPPQAQWQLLLLLTFLSAVALLTMITFRIIFFDDQRTAGYAYHFSLIFFVVMSLNYYFLGPILTILFLIVYFYKSYRFLKQ